MAWTPPALVETCIGLEINGYLSAEFRADVKVAGVGRWRRGDATGIDRGPRHRRCFFAAVQRRLPLWVSPEPAASAMPRHPTGDTAFITCHGRHAPAASVGSLITDRGARSGSRGACKRTATAPSSSALGGDRPPPQGVEKVGQVA